MNLESFVCSTCIIWRKLDAIDLQSYHTTSLSQKKDRINCSQQPLSCLKSYRLDSSFWMSGHQPGVTPHSAYSYAPTNRTRILKSPVPPISTAYYSRKSNSNIGLHAFTALQGSSKLLRVVSQIAWSRYNNMNIDLVSPSEAHKTAPPWGKCFSELRSE